MKLSTLISDGMVLQRGDKCYLWGSSEKNRQVSVTFLEETYLTYANEQGEWEITLLNLKPGGPYVMEIDDGKKHIIKDILIGDVWLLGGQSNMELPIRRTLDLYEEEVKEAENSSIRIFHVPQKYDFNGPVEELEGGSWKSVSAETILDFSAVGYFFAKELEAAQGIPIGLIQTAVGGTPAEAWINENSLLELEGYEQELRMNKDTGYVHNTITTETRQTNEWFKKLQSDDPGLQGTNWYEPDFDTQGWQIIRIPQMFQQNDLKKWVGSIWFRKEFTLTEESFRRLEEESKASDTPLLARLRLGTLVDSDDTYINGERIGSTGYKYPPRKYDFPFHLLRVGKNVIAVRLIVNYGGGGFVPDKKYLLQAGSLTVDLSGEWNFQYGGAAELLPTTTFFQYKPSGVYHGMLYPLRKYSILGAAFYQGESNTGKPENYEKLFRILIQDWRSLWKKEFPFLYVQLANYGDYKKECMDTGWAAIRDAQRKCLNVENTAMVVAIDTGEYNDLHPLNKKTIGFRLALCARKISYGEGIVSSGPLIDNKVITEDGIRLFFTETGRGLVSNKGALKNFYIAGEDKNFVPASAVIEAGDTLFVFSKEIKEPRYVRYAWEDCPEGINFYNREGLPASPFMI
ncbi:9-O-acetylesterase [Anaerocolumna cellulosilytica]|uniref:9-O-acetylesterase n=1 Tax=Anaerocolumna cellulosilytica TaxID=433286 RepID=A0A6S6R119_9FIRM|nr:sialate O-acetylesterase [Anaerocolumna cellulosilytica]MBB5194341.1 sialate O-acetylesterase [Anaerocolumna cellulosilytica]BCJ93285.1 9-O-acetylesterase [Anaerocolumna cellulosilytica]